MSNDVAAVLANGIAAAFGEADSPDDAARFALAALTAAGYAVVKVPEGVTVPHGARLSCCFTWNGAKRTYTIEATP